MKKFVKALTIIGLLILVVIGFKVYRNYSNKDKELSMNTTTWTVAYNSALNNEQSDIEGMTKLDKVNAGLNPKDGSDTDNDGLTDKEEIETYKSDPTKKSTADDLYLDGYKVENGMDLFTYCEYNAPIEFKMNSCKEVQLTATNVEDLYAVVTDITGDSVSTNEMNSTLDRWVKQYNIYKEYQIYNYSGSCSIDITNILTENNITTSDIIVLIGLNDDSIEPKKCNYEVVDNIITPDFAMEHNGTYKIVIANKTKLKTSIKYKLSTTFGSLIEDSSIVTRDGNTLVVSTILTTPCSIKPKMFYVSSGDAEKDEKMLEETAASARESTDEDLHTVKYHITTADFVELSQEEFDKEYAKYTDGIYSIVAKELDPYDKDSTFLYLLGYYTYNAISGMNEQGVTDEDFGVSDYLPFTNFDTKYHVGGSCAGISHLTTLVHNTGECPPSGAYDIEDFGTLSWDLTTDEENATLMDKYLSDYKDKSFVNNHRIVEPLTNGEKEFENMIECFWSEGNDRVKSSYKNYRTAGVTNYNWKLIEDTMAYIDKGKTVDVYLRDYSNGNGHVITLYDYQKDEAFNTNGKIYFDAYDCNYRKGSLAKRILYVSKKYADYDNYETFAFSYVPLATEKNAFKSKSEEAIDSEDKLLCFIVMDENWNILNELSN